MSIMDKLQLYLDATKKLITFLENEKNRDEKIAEIDKLLEERDALLPSIKPPFSLEEKEKGKELVNLEEKLKTLLATEKLAIQKDIKEANVKKASNQKYVNPYQSLQTDGVFYDKRK